MMKRNLFLGLLVAVQFVRMDASAAEVYPSKPVQFIIPVEAGSDGDVLARPFLHKVSDMLGKPVLVLNKPGAGSSIGYRQVHDAKPDGYTIGWGAATVATNKLQGLLPYDHSEFSILGGYATIVPVLFASTRTEKPFRNVEEVLAQARARPGTVSLGTSGVGYIWWFASRELEEATGVKFNIIPQTGGAGYTAAQVAGGHVDVGIMGLGPAKAQLESRNIAFLGVVGSRRASAPYNNIPSLKELGYSVSIESTHFVVGPDKLPKDISDKLVKTFEVAANDKEFQQFLVKLDALPTYVAPEQVVKNLNQQKVVYRDIMQKAGLLKE